MTERWAPAPGLEDRFEVSDQNRIRPVSAPLPTQSVGGQVLVTIDGTLHSVDAMSEVAFAEPEADKPVAKPSKPESKPKPPPAAAKKAAEDDEKPPAKKKG